MNWMQLGNILPLKIADGVLSDNNYLNTLLADTNHLFDQLLELEEEAL